MRRQAYDTPTAAGTEHEKGKDTRECNGKLHGLEGDLKADVALVKAEKADGRGKRFYCKVARNFNPAMAMATSMPPAPTASIPTAPAEGVWPSVPISILPGTTNFAR